MSKPVKKKTKKKKEVVVTTCFSCGKESTDDDYCSECGATMVAPVSTVTAPVVSVMVCPVCGEPRDTPDTRFCGNCRYDFVDGKEFTPPPAVVEPEEVYEDQLTLVVPPVPFIPVSPIIPAGVTSNIPAIPDLIPLEACARWELLAKVDQSLCRPGDPIPTDFTERTFPVLFDENLVGRRSDSKGIHPEIRIDDSGISRRHALIKKSANGTLSIIDLDSANGTEINGKMIPPNVETILKNGDIVVMGCWTRITVVGYN